MSAPPASREPAGAGAAPATGHAPVPAPQLAPVAATLPDGTPHADPFLAGRGWQAQGGIYVRRKPEASP
jgi:hypothetical protein